MPNRNFTLHVISEFRVGKVTKIGLSYKVKRGGLASAQLAPVTPGILEGAILEVS
jgi:hypothetical protein